MQARGVESVRSMRHMKMLLATMKSLDRVGTRIPSESTGEGETEGREGAAEAKTTKGSTAKRGKVASGGVKGNKGGVNFTYYITDVGEKYVAKMDGAVVAPTASS